MKKKLIFAIISTIILWHGTASAKIDLVTLPNRDTAQLTIYNSADITLVRESRALTLKNGVNSLQFSWVNTLIDPTSLELLPKEHGVDIDVLELVFPPRVRNAGLWHIQSRTTGKIPVEITYLTSGLSWRAFYLGTLSSDENTMHLDGYVRVTNASGEDYENAQVRLVVGKINIIDEISYLAKRHDPYGSPLPFRKPAMQKELKTAGMRLKGEAARTFGTAEEMMLTRPKEIVKEGLSEYFLYTIEGTESIPDGWSKRLPSFKTENIPVLNLYKFEEEKYGNNVVRFISFKNNNDHNLGKTPIPGGTLKVYRNADASQHLSYAGQSDFKYIPVDEDVELNLGSVNNVIVKSLLMDYKTNNYMYDKKGNISGWDEIREFEIETNNTRHIPVKVEIKLNFTTPSWALEKSGDYGTFEKIDLDTATFTVNLHKQDKKTFRYVLTTHHGQRAD